MSNENYDTDVRPIVNADDFGLSRNVNRGIVESHKSGIVTSASVFANGPAFENAVNDVLDNPRLGLGVHLNILRGKSVSDPRFTTAITQNGFFFSGCRLYHSD